MESLKAQKPSSAKDAQLNAELSSAKGILGQLHLFGLGISKP